VKIIPGTSRQGADTALQDYRYERKFFIDEMDAREAIHLIKLHPALFSEIYPPRYINNIYLDSPLMENYGDNIDGAPERLKARVRWYHELFGSIKHPELELKVKKGLMGAKLHYALPGFVFDADFSESLLKDLFRSGELPEDVRSHLLACEPVLVNRYLRWYYATPDRRFRVTVDSGLSFYHLSKLGGQLFHHQQDYHSIVVELKYQREDDPKASRISSAFPFRMTRSSKYTQGIERVYL
jgi:hypothetical protein